MKKARLFLVLTLILVVLSLAVVAISFEYSDSGNRQEISGEVLPPAGELPPTQ